MPRKYGRKQGKKDMHRIEFNVIEAEYTVIEQLALIFNRKQPGWREDQRVQIAPYLRHLVMMDVIQHGLEWPYYDYSKGGDYISQKDDG